VISSRCKRSLSRSDQCRFVASTSATMASRTPNGRGPHPGTTSPAGQGMPNTAIDAPTLTLRTLGAIASYQDDHEGQHGRAVARRALLPD